MTHLVSVPASREHQVGRAFLAQPAPHSHAVQLYDSDTYLLETVTHFLAAGLKAREHLLVIATAEHREAFKRQLPAAELAEAVSAGRVLLLDARETLARFMIADLPDATLFHDLLSGALGELCATGAPRRVRAYGEMVDVLWREGNSRAAIRLEELWNEAGRSHSFSLLCAYSMGHFYREGETARFMEVCRSHTHVLPTEAFTALEDPHARLREISLLQQRARALESELLCRTQLEEALRDALVERARVEQELRACVRREQEARANAEAADSYKEMFLGILGHDLRNPLNTVLTTARLMKMRGELGPDGDRRADRIISSGVRMERMITQLLDVTRARLADGLPLKRSPQDLAALALKIAEELRVAHPGRTINVQTERPCQAFVDPDRIEQVLSNVVGNALAHGDPARPVTLAVDRRAEVATVSVHNFGPPIDPAFLPLLFDPFKRGNRAAHQQGGAAGLGLGLYISERIVSAHGGRIEVTSDAIAGTRFEVMLTERAT
jgi:signal transduction histidine kinase